jgi:hypothetical protein
MLFDLWHENGPHGISLGSEYIINDDGDISHAVSSSSTSHASTSPTHSTAPAPTLVGSSNGFEIDLIWDASVANAPSGFMQAIIAAAQYYTTLFSNKVEINIDVGYGEIAGSPLSSGALGESESYGYLTNYATVVNALHVDNDPPPAATNDPTTAQFFVTSAEAKIMGLISGNSSAVDGFIALTNAYPMNYTTAGPAAKSSQFDAFAIAEHELTEVLGRIGLEGEVVNGKPTYTPLDLFDFKSAGVLELSANGGYFSVNDGKTDLNTYNDAAVNGGDISDWASNVAPTGTTYDSYNAFTWPGYDGGLSTSDILEDAALGLKLTPAGVAVA